MELKENRKEPRFPFYLPMQIARVSQGKTQEFQGILKNISMSGLRVLSKAWLKQGEEVVCNLDIPEIDGSTSHQGIVRWAASNGGNHFGIELLESQNLALPLERMTQAFSQTTPAEPTEKPSESLNFLPLQHLFYSEIFWGLFFRTLSAPLQSHLFSLSSELDLKKHSLSCWQLSPQDQDQPPDSAELEQTLHKTQQALEKINRLWQQLLNVPVQETRCTPLQPIQFNDLLMERVTLFRDILDSVLHERPDTIQLNSQELPEVQGHLQTIAMSLDLLLLFSYQFVLFFEAKQITINTAATNQHISISFDNDGSQIFDAQTIPLSASSPFFLENFKPRDRKRLAILCCALDMFQPLKTNISLYNQSGNNSLLVTIPYADSQG